MGFSCFFIHVKNSKPVQIQKNIYNSLGVTKVKAMVFHAESLFSFTPPARDQFHSEIPNSDQIKKKSFQIPANWSKVIQIPESSHELLKKFFFLKNLQSPEGVRKVELKSQSQTMNG